MKTKIEMKKAKAVEFLKMMGICQDYIDIFREKGVVTYYDRYIGFWAFQDEELMAKIKEIEEKWNVLVFAVTHEFNEDCEIYSVDATPFGEKAEAISQWLQVFA